jgi:hypothetical protein
MKLMDNIIIHINYLYKIGLKKTMDYLIELNKLISEIDPLKFPEAEGAVVCISPRGIHTTAFSSACDKMRDGGSFSECVRQPIENIHCAVDYIKSAETKAEMRGRVLEVAQDTALTYVPKTNLFSFSSLFSPFQKIFKS